MPDSKKADRTNMEEIALRGGLNENAYDRFHRTVEVQIFPQNLRVTWDDNGCCVSFAVLLIAALVGLTVSGYYLKQIHLNEAQVNSSETLALFSETHLLIVALFCGGILLGFFVMCLCGVNTQLMAAKKRRFGSLRKNRILLSLMRGQSAWDEPEFQRRLRQQDRRIDRVQDTVEARLESWLNQRDARVRYMQEARIRIAKERARKEMKANKHVGCTVL
ncbi:hypothetical protein BOX15_Mlig005607g1 [Macrostomum lignano]|uniref:Uncharacterized protein n=2 Tax=Macrostomum lignano TaxID=282301 RepID=A0A267FLI8_9PLAT|nr:hypothetical protein BOX15_Mlig005607g1 [Macrostomum lignano]